MEEWKLTIIRGSNGYIIEGTNGEDSSYKLVIQEDDKDELKAHEELLWEIMEYFAFLGSKHDSERLRIVRERKEE